MSKTSSVEKLEKDGVKLSQSEKNLLNKADDLKKKISEGKIEKEKGNKKIMEIFKKLTINERY